MINFDEIYTSLSKIAAASHRPALLAIDGRCGSGKSTLGEKLAAEWDAALFHMDDFYLQPHQRTPERLSEPGGNVDRERFLSEVLLPLRAGTPVHYRRFDCDTFSFEPAKIIEAKAIAIIEGSYSCHPLLRNYYDLRIFLDIDPEIQLERIGKRNGPEALKRFQSTWIPLEETYFRECAVPDCCDYRIKMITDSLQINYNRE